MVIEMALNPKTLNPKHSTLKHNPKIHDLHLLSEIEWGGSHFRDYFLAFLFLLLVFTSRPMGYFVQIHIA